MASLCFARKKIGKRAEKKLRNKDLFDYKGSKSVV